MDKMSTPTESDSSMDASRGGEKNTEETQLIKSKMGAPGTPGDLTGRLILAIFTASLGMFQFGYNTGVINAPRSVMETFYNKTYTSRKDEPISDDLLTLLWSFTVASFAVGGMIGGILGAWWADKFGRKQGMLFNTGFGIAAALFMGLSKLAGSYEMVIIGRLIVGFNCGLYTGLTPLYNAEIAPTNLRGAIGTVNQLAVTIGMLISQVFGLGEIMGTEDLWPLLLGLTVVPPVLQIVLLQFIPESPRYSLLTKGDEDSTMKTLQQLRGVEDVHNEMEEMVREKAAQENEKTLNMLEIFQVQALRMPLLVAVTMHLSQQFSGINCIFYYSTSLFENVGLTPEQASYATMSVGGIMVIMTLVSIPLMDRLGRKTLHLGGLSGMFILSIVFTIAFHFATEKNEEWLQYFTISAALCIVVFFAVGPGSIPWMIVAELFPQGPRAAAVNIGVLVNWGSNFIVSISFPFLQEALEELVFVPFTVLLLLFIVVLLRILPETKGKTIEQISLMFSQDLSALSSKTEATGDRGSAGTFTTL